MEVVMKPIRFRVFRFLRTAAAVLVTAGGLAACGGGSSGGVNTGGGGGGGNAAPCLSTQGGGSGFALGSCLSTQTSVFQPVTASVVVNAASVVDFPSQDGYTLSLLFPSGLQSQQSLDGTTGFTMANQPPASDRNIVGVLRGQAYESPLHTELTPPYVALTDFHRNWSFATEPSSNPPLLAMSHASFGTWEKFPNSTTNDGFLGVWYAPRDLSNNATWPAGPADIVYEGRAVGVIAPTGSTGALTQPFGFSGHVLITVDGGTGRIKSGQLDGMQISYRTSSGLAVADPGIKTIALSTGTGTSPNPTTGTLSTAAGGTGANLVSGDYEAKFFAPLGDPGAELAGQMRFTTDSGLVGVASFGAVRLP